MSTAIRMLIVDDDADALKLMQLHLSHAGHDVVTASSGEHALNQLTLHYPQLVLVDLCMPVMDGMQLLQRLLAHSPRLPVVMMTGSGEIADAVKATQAGAVDFLVKPMSIDALLACIDVHVHPGWEDAIYPEKEGVDLITKSPLMRAVLDEALLIARTQSPVIITGSSGTGKELLARSIHRASQRSHKPFVALNCSAMPAGLLESELFGHQRGAFTGAISDNPGLFRAAEGGTLFLDEIGDMPPNLQAKLLRVLQDGEVRPVGSTKSVRVDVRMLCATHRDLPQLIKSGDFREDLYYRLNVVSLRLPDLMERREDIPGLVQHRLATMYSQGSRRQSFTPSAMELLVSADWPGNIRQLFNVVEQNVAMSAERVIGAHAVRRTIGEANSSIPTLKEARDRFISGYVREVIAQSDGNISEAARRAGRNRTDFYKVMRRADTGDHGE